MPKVIVEPKYCRCGLEMIAVSRYPEDIYSTEFDYECPDDCCQFNEEDA